MDAKQLCGRYIADTYNRFDAVFTRGTGSILVDEKGREYIDLGGGIAVNIFGVGDEEWERAVCGQIKKLQHASNLYYTLPQARLASLLCEKTGMSSVFFSNSGAEANECMIKAARKYSGDRYGPGRSGIITLNGSFHGRTVTTLSATGQERLHRDFGPFTEGFFHTEPDDLSAIEALISRGGVCAVMLETILGEGGVRMLGRGYAQGVAELCRANDILLLIDEVQTGNGRTGALYSYMKYGLDPDIFSTAKGLGGGLPIGATLFGPKTFGVLGVGSHGSTFGGNPVCAAGAVSVIERLDDGLLAEVEHKGEFIKSFLSGAAGVKSVTGMGLMIGVETESDPKTIADDCLRRGLAVLTAQNKVRLLPALNIPLNLLRDGLAILKAAIAAQVSTD
jgi:acetylornithine/N-succinyldiaminopimelate aminotransferase